MSDPLSVAVGRKYKSPTAALLTSQKRGQILREYNSGRN
jgi:hypothetical protein